MGRQRHAVADGVTLPALVACIACDAVATHYLALDAPHDPLCEACFSVAHTTCDHCGQNVARRGEV